MNKILKLALCVLLIVAMLCSAIPVLAAESLTVVVESVEDYRNKEITLAVDVTGNPGIAYLALSLSYDKEYLSFVGAKNGSIIKDFDSGTNLVWTADNDSTATGTLVSLTFKLAESAPVMLDSFQSVTLIARECYDENFNDVAVTVQPGGIEALCGHEIPVPIAAVPATCDRPGYGPGVGCFECPMILEDPEYIPATGKHEDADGKWESDSAEHYHTCSCGTVIDKAAHSGGTATCTQRAVCSVCGVSYGEVNAAAHGKTEVRGAVAASCKTDGYTGDTYCTDCGKKTATGKVITATGKHVDADGKWESDGTNHYHTCACGTAFDKAAHSGSKATCTQKAQCTVCGAAYGAVDQANHANTEVKDAVAATCEKDGYTGDTYCADCGEKLADGTVIPGGHKIEKVEAAEPTHDVPGHTEHYACGGCGSLYADENGTQPLTEAEVLIPKGEHSYSEQWSSDETGHWHGCDCGSKIEEADHTYGEWTMVQQATEDTDGSKTRTCCVCAYVQTEAVPASGNTDTGDGTEVWLFAALMAMSLCGMAAAFCLYYGRKGKYEI